MAIEKLKINYNTQK